MNKEDLKKFVEANPKLVTLKSTSNPEIFVLKYTRKVFYDSLWNTFLEECRGTVIDKDYNVVSLPFTKIYNLGVEASAPEIDDTEIVKVFRKVNGFMLAVTWHNEALLVSTTGSIDSDFVKMGWDHINEKKFTSVCRANPDTTFLFECVHKNDPHIIPEEEGLYLLAYRKKHWSSRVEHDHIALENCALFLGCYVPEYFWASLEDVKFRNSKCQHEGFVVYTEDDKSAKMKSPYYLALKALARKADILSLDKKRVDEEFYPLLDYIKDNSEYFNSLPEQDRLIYIRNYLGVE